MPSAIPNAMDIFSTHRIPFAVAAWCRGHKFNTNTAELARKLREAADVQAKITALEQADAALQADIRVLVARIEDLDARDAISTSAPPPPPPVVARRVRPE